MSLPVQKNESIVLDIVSIGEGGEGIGRPDGFTVFVHGAIPGDQIKAKIIKVKKTFAIGRLEEIIVESEDRITPPCPYANKCGGCQMQHASYDAQLNYKQEFVESAMTRIAKIDTPVERIIGMEEPFRYRNKGMYPVAGDKKNPKIGLYRSRSHDVVDVDVCLLQRESADKVVSMIREALPELGWSIYNEETGKGFLRHILIRTAYKTGDLMLVFVINGYKITGIEPFVNRLIDEVPELRSVILNENKAKSNKVLGTKNKVIWGNDKIMDFIGDLAFEISPLSFFQVNPVQTEVLYSKALEFAELTGEETVFDIYCGIGSISLFLAQKAKKVIGVEVVGDAVRDAKENAKHNAIDNCEFHTGLAERVIPALYEEGQRADVVVVDPPRKGCDPIVLETIVKMDPKRVVYVSCKPSTLARDLAILKEAGYETTKVQPVDMFPMTGHVETVVQLVK